jgi:spore germination protein YaaH
MLPLSLSSCASAPPAAPPVAPPETEEVVENRDNMEEEEADIPSEEADDFFIYGELPEGTENLAVLHFTEIWGYLVAGREQGLKLNYPISDLAYFGAEIDTYGKLTDVPNRRKVASFPGRVHLVLACNGRSLTHFILEPGSVLRKALVADLLEAAKPYDGLQIDFELIPGRDGDNFLSFLKELRDGLGNKMFTIAVPARRKTISDDIFNYEKIKPLVDRIFVMAYDEHWSTSAPGSIASLGWCRSVAEYALKAVGPEKLVMGLPFYGRAWGDANPSIAYVHSGIEKIKTENSVTDVIRDNGIPTFTYKTTVKVTAYYEDIHSLNIRSGMYRGIGVKSLGFWALGQEDPNVWNFFKLNG